MDIKEESCFPGFCSENERDAKDLERKIKIETITSSSDIKPELEEYSTCSQNKKHHMRFNEIVMEGEIESKIDIKEDWWLEGEDSSINDIKEKTHEDLYSTKPASLYKQDVSTFTSDLFSTEDLQNDISFNMNMNSTLCGSDIKCQGQEAVLTDIASIETRLCPDTSEDGKIGSMASSLEQTKLLHHSNPIKQDISNKNCMPILSHKCSRSCEYDISKKCSTYSCHLNKCSLVLNSGKQNMCDVLNKGLNQFLSLKTQKLIDEGGKPHKCNICNKSFTRLQLLKTHKLNHEGIKPHKCDICNKVFTTFSNLKRHKLIHEGIKPHKCNICNKCFTLLSHLKSHKLIHDGIKPHKCNICNKCFTLLSHLKSHKLIHDGIKPHKCNVCNKAFTELSSLKSHKLIHEGLKPHKCNICNKDFTRLSHLKRHKLIHDGVKSHKCNICNNAFTQLSSLKRHTLSHKDKQPQ